MSVVSDVWDGALSVLGTVAPVIAGALAGPLAGTAVGALCQALNLDPASSPAAVVKAVQSATPDQLAALQVANNNFEIAMRNLGISEEKLAFDDKKDARNLQVVTRSNVPAVLGFTVTLGFFGLLTASCFYGFPTANATMLNMLLGTLAAVFTQVAAYYFGSSSQSSEQSKMLYNSQPVK